MNALPNGFLNIIPVRDMIVRNFLLATGKRVEAGSLTEIDYITCCASRSRFKNTIFYRRLSPAKSVQNTPTFPYIL